MRTRTNKVIRGRREKGNWRKFVREYVTQIEREGGERESECLLGTILRIKVDTKCCIHGIKLKSFVAATKCSVLNSRWYLRSENNIEVGISKSLSTSLSIEREKWKYRVSKC